MCFGGGGGTDKTLQKFTISEAERARLEEQQRQSRIQFGMDQIAAIFEGGRMPTLARARGGYDPRESYFTEDGSAWAPFEKNKKGFLKQRSGEDAERLFGAAGPLFTRAQGKAQGGMQPILDARRDAMRSFYLPQLEQEMGDTRDDLTFALSRAGLLSSTVAKDKEARLNEGYNLERAGILSDISRDVANTRGALQDQRSSIEGALRSSGDVTAATNAALSSRGTFAADRPDLDPIGDVLAGFAQGIGGGVQAARSAQIRNTARGAAPATRNLSRIAS